MGWAGDVAADVVADVVADVASVMLRAGWVCVE
jgi:uncharacterized protein (DUF934 family)